MTDVSMPAPEGEATHGATGGAILNTALDQFYHVRSVFPETWLWCDSTIGFVQIRT